MNGGAARFVRGVRLTFDAQGSATCPESGESYRLDGERVSAT